MNSKLTIIKKYGVEISRVLVGTSPFIAAGQFENSDKYYMEFVVKRGKAAEILSWCLINGFSWIQALDVDFLAQEIDLAYRRTGIKPAIVLSTWSKPEKAVKRYEHLDLRIVLAHASIVDRLNEVLIRNFIKQIENLGLTAGIATHRPTISLPRLKHIEEVKVVMVPLNYVRLFTDDIEETLKVLREMRVVVIAKKVLGAGRLSVDAALQWVLGIPEVDSVALGVASVSEAEKTLRTACELTRTLTNG
ncbi:MAG: hypothetical protein N3F04_06645 [Candidatus Nezhaarchaeota archaeon]|nr:hypothetical protein [Candidatus Nezhaarchaeota archaeon]MCX8142420.1 hypothetical protein [Candidatus Nezhaarchaeota archaeon]MDW8050607.1 hypothetical protein [Nitrososphaerota archaeon]